jgi:predicted ester cyclase
MITHAVPSGAYSAQVAARDALLATLRIPGNEQEPASASSASPEAANAAIVRTLFEQVYSQGNLDLIDELYAPEYVEQQPNLPSDREGARSAIVALRVAFPDLEVVIEEIAASEDRIWVRSTMRGTNLGEIFGLPATGRSVEISWFDDYQVADGKIVAHWGAGDELRMLQQLGFKLVAPSPTVAEP